MSSENWWSVALRRHPLVMNQSQEWLEGEQLKSQADYHGVRHYETEEKAKEAALELLDKITALNPGVGWKVTWWDEFCSPGKTRGTGKCCWAIREPSGDQN